ncbi:MAG: heme ABC transporter ATP-binding protein [Corynebacterium sp.]|nr:heme ABC transporter ATP-binding protein [Corynebacterium sp.]
MSVTVSNVSVTVDSGKKLLHEVTFTARKGEVTGLIGPNGAGKSTLLAAISGDLAYTGSITVDGVETAQTSPSELARRRAVMLQDVSVAFSFLVRDVVAMGRGPWVPSPDDDALIDAALGATDVSHLAHRDVMTLSGGERARVALSRVVAQTTPVILLDEPTAAMDIRHSERALGLARYLAQSGAAVIAVLHDLNAAASYCDQVVCLSHGSVAATGSVSEVFTEENLSAVYEWPISVYHISDRTIVAPQGGDGASTTPNVSLLAWQNQPAARDTAAPTPSPSRESVD